MRKDTARKNLRARSRLGRLAQDGFTLIETMFAMVFLSIGLLAIAQLIPLASSQIVSSRNHTLASEMAQDTLEDLGTVDYSDPALVAGTHSATSGKHTVTYTVTDDTPVPGCKQVAMTVSWDEATGTKTVSYNTLISQ